jgi:hypothetical protein
LVKAGRVLPKGGKGVSETRGKEVAPIQVRGMEAREAAVNPSKESQNGGYRDE